MDSTRWPKCIFKLSRLKAVPEPPKEELEPWNPPRCPNPQTSMDRGPPHNVKGSEATTVFYCDSTRIYVPRNRHLDETRAQHYKTISAYNCAGVLKMVDYDVTRYHVGSAQPPATVRASTSQDQSRDVDGYMDWHTIRFKHCERTGTSYATYGEEHARALVHWENARWPYFLLPQSCRSEELTEDPRRGGMNVNLQTLIVLLAFSVRERDMVENLQNCLQGGSYNPPRRQSVWAGRYGIVVEILTWPDDTTVEDLNNFGSESGQPPIFQNLSRSS